VFNTFEVQNAQKMDSFFKIREPKLLRGRKIEIGKTEPKELPPVKTYVRTHKIVIPPPPPPPPEPEPVPEPEPEPEPEPVVEEPKGEPLSFDVMKDIVFEKLQLIDQDAEEHKAKIRELWDDIQILAFIEEGELEQAKIASEALEKHIGPQKLKTLLKIIGKIGNKDITPPQKAVKRPPSWLQDGTDPKPKSLHVVNSKLEIDIQLL